MNISDKNTAGPISHLWGKIVRESETFTANNGLKMINNCIPAFNVYTTIDGYADDSEEGSFRRKTQWTTPLAAPYSCSECYSR